MNTTTVDAATRARMLAADPLTPAPIRDALGELLAELEWESLQTLHAKVASDDMEERLHVITRLHDTPDADGYRGSARPLCSRCGELAPCRTYRAARGVTA